MRNLVEFKLKNQLNDYVMKTLKIYGIVLITVVLGFGTVHAQNNVKKTERVWTPYGYLECTGDWLGGTAICEDIISPHNWVTLIKKVEVTGYKDQACTEPSGNVYELSQMISGSPVIDWFGHDGWFESTGKFTLDGKIVANFHERMHMSTNANGEVTVDFWEWRIDCK